MTAAVRPRQRVGIERAAQFQPRFRGDPGDEARIGDVLGEDRRRPLLADFADERGDIGG
jgi:hypothetical protein